MNMLPRARFSCIAGVLMLLVSRSAAARPPWVPFDLDSLVFHSEVVVLAERTAERAAIDARGKAVPLARYRVKEVYEGTLARGETLEVLDDSPRSHGSGKSIAFDADAVLFLERFSEHSAWKGRNLEPRDRPRFAIVRSGLRLLAQGKVYEFREGLSGIEPSPAGRQFPLSGRHEQPAVSGRFGYSISLEPLSVAEFEKELRGSLARVERFHQARRTDDMLLRRRAMLEILRPYEEEAARQRERLSLLFTPKSFLQEIAGALLAANDVEGALEVIERSGFHEHEFSIDPDLLLQAAKLEGMPLRLRLTAIRSLPWELFRDLPRLQVLGALAGSSTPEVAQAAREKLRWLHRGYTMNDRGHAGGPLGQFWKDAAALAGTDAGKTADD
jgi:hypothetical protein